MPHKCTNCGNVFDDGSDDILSGCDCGSRKFEYVGEDGDTPTQEQSQSPAQATKRDDATEEGDPTDSMEDSIIIADENPIEDESQHKARSEVVSEEDLPHMGNSPTSMGERKKDIDEVKEQLHEQFEGIRILEPGNYQINLMKLYEKQECVISLQEDGRYIINVPGMMDSDVETGTNSSK